MKITQFRFLKSLTAVAAFSLMFNFGAKAQITIDANATPLNTHADQVGLWVNSNSDTYQTSYVNLLKDLNLKSIRHGWMYTTMDATTTDKFKMSPCDGSIQSYLSDGSCNLNETMKLSKIGQLATDLNVPGFAVLAMDGINYTGTSDATLTAMTKAQREQYYLDNAVRWATWAKTNNFKYFELGNENDLPGEMVNTGKGTEWTPQAYGAFAKRMAQAVKNVDPTIKCGINGGWRSTEALRKEWWDGILTGAPDINSYIDFVVIHKYEFGSYYSTWSANLWDWGRIQADNITAIKANFPNKPIYITETSGYQNENGIVPHYRGVLTVEMMGNLFMDSQIEHIHNWGTRWGDELNFDKSTDTYNMLGNSLKTYTKFMKPIMFANGTNVSKNIRYFASKNVNDNSATLWIINHASSASSISVSISNFPSQTQGDVWKLTSASDSPTASDNSLTQTGSVTAAISGGTATFSVNINATSVTVVTFSGTVLPPNVLPTCSITAPTNNQSFITTDNVTFSATASDSDGSISQVEFFIDDISKGSDNTSPYSVVVNGLTAGSHTLYAKATDNRGDVTKSSTVTINVTAAPKYALTVTNGTGTGSYEANKVVPIVANAAASGNEFDKWTGATSYIANVNSASTTVNMPTSAITVTATYKVLLIDTTVNVALNKTASQVTTYIGAVASRAVDGNTNGNFNNNSVTHTLCGTQDWWRVDLGSITNVGKIKVYNRTDCCGERLDDYTVKVLDASMAQVWSSFQSNPAGTPTSLTTGGKTGRYVEVQLSGTGCLSIAEVEVFAQNDPSVPANVAPTCSISAPANNAVFAIGSNVDITANAADSDGSISNVDFYVNGSKVGSDNTWPYNYTATGLGAATYTMYAKATDNKGATTQSASINIRVNAAPTVSITTPANASVIKPGDNVTITANTSDADGTISLVEFYRGTTKLGEDLSSPYSYTWTSPANGDYALTAVATDNNSAKTTSAIVNISVKVSADPTKYRYLKLTGEKLLKEGALIEEVYWLVGTTEYPTPRLDNSTAYRVTAVPNIDNAWHAYNGNDQPWQVLFTIPASITLDMLAGKEIGVTGIKIKALNNERGFADLSCYGSNDGVNFTLLAHATGLTAASYPNGLATLTFANLKSGAIANSINSTNTLSSKIFPNPASQQIFVKTVGTSANVEVFDLMGQLILRNANVLNEQAVDISTLKGGMYFLKVSDNTGNIDIHKFVVK